MRPLRVHQAYPTSGTPFASLMTRLSGLSSAFRRNPEGVPIM